MKKYFFCLSMLIMLILTVSCSQSLTNGIYGAKYGSTDSNGWMHELSLHVQRGRISAAYYLIRNRAGDIDRARMRTAQPLLDMLVERQSVPAEAPRGSVSVYSALEPLMTYAVQRAESGRPGWTALERPVIYTAATWSGDGGYPEASIAVGVNAGSVTDVDFEILGSEDSEIVASLEQLLEAVPSPNRQILFALGEDLRSADAAPIVDTFRLLAVRALDRTGMPRPIEVAEVKDLAESDAVTVRSLAEGAPHNMQEAVVSAHYLASQSGMRVLQAGGTAADAAFAVAAVLSVVEPWFSSVLGGGTWALYYDRTSDRLYSQDGVGWLPSGATADAYRPLAGENGFHQSIVPGAWDGWMIWLKRFGRLPLGELLEDAIHHAEEGAPASEKMVLWINIESDNLRQFEKSREIYLRDGAPPEPGEMIYNREMAETFRELVRAYEEASVLYGERAAFNVASDYYYRGPLAREIMEFSRKHNGFFELPDFYRFYAQIVDPISIDYHGIQVYENPPNSQGITMLIGLNILKGFDLSGYTVDSPEAVHLQVESAKLAHVDKYYHVGAPEYVDVPVDELLSEEHARVRREQISLTDTLHWPIEDVLNEGSSIAGAHTTTYQIVDRYGNAASVTTSLGAQFLVIDDTGIHINNRMRMISVEEGNSNYAVPGKKVRHTSNPYVALLDGRPYILGGNTGVDTQPQGQMQQFVSVVEFGLSPQKAVARPRWITQAFPAGMYPWTASNNLAMEPGTSQQLRDALGALGHRITSNGIWGNANMIVIDPSTGEVETGVDPWGDVGGAETRPIER